MNSSAIDASQQATGTCATTNLDDRTSTLQSFIIASGLELSDLAHEAGKHRLFFTTPEAILAKLAGNIHRYGGPTDEAAFLKWARRFVAREAQRYVITGEILEEYENLIHKAIHESLWTSALDLSTEHQDIFWEVVFLIFQKAHALKNPGPAKLSTRIWSLVKKHIYKYHNAKKANRLRLVRLHKNELFLHIEHLSEEELAAMKASDADDNAPYDPGYAEAGLSMV